MAPLPPVLESFRVAADVRSPGRVRRRLADLLAAAGREDAVEAALLLVTELITNGVVHAGTEIGVTVWVSADAVAVAVQDSNPAPLPTAVRPRAADPLAEGGRGLALIDRVAGSWGVTHEQDTKTVWFALPSRVGASRPLAPLASDGSRRRRPLLLAVDPGLREGLTVDQEVGELLARLLDALDVDGGEVWLDRPTRHLAVTRGRTDPAGSVLELPLSAGRRELGSLRLVHGGADAFTSEDEGLAQLAAARIALALRSADVDAAELRRSGWTAFLAEASDLLAGSLDVRHTLVLLCQLAVSRLADWSAVLLADPSGRLAPVASAHVDEAAGALLPERLAAEGVVHRLGGQGDDMRPLLLPGETGVAVGLRARGRELGRLLVMRPSTRPFDADELAVIRDLAGRAALAIDNARLFEEQAQVAQALQARLLPPELPNGTTLEFGACYHSARAGLDVGGDFYDVGDVPPDGWVVAIGDVCGKGAEAAAVTGVVRDVLRLLLRQDYPLAAALRGLNETLLRQGHGSRFCTVAVARLEQRSAGRWSVRVCSAGHPLPVLVHPDGTVAVVGRPGTLLGVVEDADLDLGEDEIELLPGDALVFYTDGVTERRRRGELFSESGLLSVLRGCVGMTAPAIAAAVDRATDAFTAEPLRDDMAVLVLRARPMPDMPQMPDSEDVLVR